VIDQRGNDVLLMARAWLKARAQEQDPRNARHQIIDELLQGPDVSPDPEKLEALRSPVAAVDQALASLVTNTPEAAWQVVLQVVELAPTPDTFRSLSATIAVLLRAQPQLFIARLGVELSKDERWLDAVRLVATLSNLRRPEDGGLADETRQQLARLATRPK
jgi:hypothetical protein